MATIHRVNWAATQPIIQNVLQINSNAAKTNRCAPHGAVAMEIMPVWFDTKLKLHFPLNYSKAHAKIKFHRTKSTVTVNYLLRTCDIINEMY